MTALDNAIRVAGSANKLASTDLPPRLDTTLS